MKFLFFLVLSSVCMGNICEIYDLGKLDLNDLDQGSLVVFDIDEVLITSNDLFFHPSLESYMLGLVGEEMSKTKDKEELQNKLSLSLLETKKRVVEPKIIKSIDRLKEKGVKVLALTHFPTGRLGKIPRLETFKLEELRAFQIDFSEFFGRERHEFPELLKSGKPVPFFEKGVLFARGVEKGKALLAFLDWVAFKPKCVVFVDDLLENAVNVQDRLKERGIQFRGFHFRGLDHTPTERDKEVIRMQMRHLVEKNQWLNDKQ